MAKSLAILALCIIATGCNPSLDNQPVWDAKGCAYLVRDGLGDIRYVRRIAWNDKPTCTANVGSGGSDNAAHAQAGEGSNHG